MIIFEGEELLLHYHEGTSDYILITFTSADQTEQAQNNYFLKPIVEKYDLSCLGITTKFDNYYQHSDMYHIIPLCNEIAIKYKKILVTGLSMAAYAALKFSALLNADIVFAMGARYTLDANIASVSGIMQRTVDRLDPHSIVQTTIQSHEVSGKIYIAHDTYQGSVGYNATDHEHIDKIRENLPNTVLVPVLFAHHLVINSLKGSEEFKSILDMLITGNDQDVIQQVIKIRRHHIHNIYSKIKLLRHRYPLLVFKLLASKVFSTVKNNHIIFDDNENNLLLIYSLCKNNHHQQSRNLLRLCFLRAYLKCSFYEADQINSRHNMDDNNSLSHLPYLIAHNYYILVYDQAKKKIIPVRDFIYNTHCLPVRLYGDQSGYRLVCVWEDVLFKLHYRKGEILITPFVFEDQQEDIIVVEKQENIAIIYSKDRKLCFQVDLQGNGNFYPNKPREWEQFAII
ncbi:hypothetical protein [Commensalibacter papalotli (ex Botero et al. 2024)]|uniref:Tetratricopeptide (TPR) repeat (TPR) (PDB:3AS4) n=1 Tax=Commensalibacter papalotli (ex Botero et al. 2024) TaxID=2972766 RepID=A0ABM9HLB9_9PROT|nr:hypothetical protein [Commensalibacter papalotli (ex Botero et al. 2024)]CAI3933355.1 Tetratricopeptide (TPR) repeat (TPR) (PDB:3AS4) [Commensalibacter papalotli (ex Botero et al. 2024)]CAI3949368.1 Tetratricopeptide (TPR) repeat (TPR) (PDB:3AS4) [Commensalibacter papalotli (ex Botero et al. 2024)]